MKCKTNADNIIALIKSRHGIERKKICETLGLTFSQFTGAQPYIKPHCYREAKQWYMTVVDVVPPRIRKSPTATIVYRMMPVSQMGLKERLGMHKDAVWRALKLLKEHRLIHITGYETNNTTIFPKFDKGHGIDATRPDSRELANQRSNRYKQRNVETVREKNAAYRERNKDVVNAKGMVRYWAKADDINARARERARLKREAPPEKPKMPVTQWLTVTPWEVGVVNNPLG